MNQFDVFHWQPPGWDKPHPCVIVSHSSRVANKPEVNVLMCSTQRATRQAEAGEVILDTADGMDWPTICKCDLIHVVNKSLLMNRKGAVSPVRRLKIVQTIVAGNGWGNVASL